MKIKVMLIMVFIASMMFVNCKKTNYISFHPTNSGNLFKTFGSLLDMEVGYSVRQTSDGGYIILGHEAIVSTSESCLYIIKTDSSGNKSWERKYCTLQINHGEIIRQTSDGGYIMIGNSTSFSTSRDIYLLKVDSNGDCVWAKTFGGTGTEYGYSIHQTNDGGYITCGISDSYSTGDYDMYLLKLDASGNQTWNKIIGNTDDNYARSIIQTNDGGYAVAGYNIYSLPIISDACLLKLDSTGNSLWSKTYNQGDSVNFILTLQQTNDNGYVLFGNSDCNDNVDGYIIKTDSTGNCSWAKTYGGTSFDDFKEGQQTSDGGYISIGNSTSYSTFGISNMFIVKTDTTGNSTWSNTVDISSNNIINGNSVYQTTDGNFIAVGAISSNNWDILLIQLDLSGNRIW